MTTIHAFTAIQKAVDGPKVISLVPMHTKIIVQNIRTTGWLKIQFDSGTKDMALNLETDNVGEYRAFQSVASKTLATTDAA